MSLKCEFVCVRLPEEYVLDVCINYQFSIYGNLYSTTSVCILLSTLLPWLLLIKEREKGIEGE